ALTARHHLSRIERKRAGDAERAGHPAAVCRAMRVGSVLEQEHATLSAHPPDLLDVRRYKAADVDDDHTCRLWPDLSLEILNADRHRLRIAVQEADGCARVHRGSSGGKEGIGGDQYFFARDTE